jgi:hypothetical protein
MKVFLACFAMLFWSAQCLAQASCAGDADVFVDCQSNCGGKPNSQPSDLVWSLAENAATLDGVPLCTNQSMVIWIQSTEKRPGGYAEYDWYFDVDSTGQIVFDYLEIDNEQVPKVPKPGHCEPGSKCLGGTGWIQGSDGTEYGTSFSGTNIYCPGLNQQTCS